MMSKTNQRQTTDKPEANHRQTKIKNIKKVKKEKKVKKIFPLYPPTGKWRFLLMKILNLHLNLQKEKKKKVPRKKKKSRTTLSKSFGTCTTRKQGKRRNSQRSG